MAIILDASVIVGGERGKFDFRGWLASRPSETFEVAAITVAELWHGVERAAPVHKAKRQQYLQAILAALPVISYTEQTAYHHARIWAELEVSCRMIGFYDVILAATAVERGSVVATFNIRHFEAVNGLQVLLPQ